MIEKEKIVETIAEKLTDDTSKSSLFLSKDDIDRFYNHAFSQSFTGFSKEYANAVSPASGIFKKIVKRISSALFSKFPEFTTDNVEVRELIDKNKEDLENTFKKAIHNYVLYGFSVLSVDDNGNLVPDLDDRWFCKNGVLCERGAIDQNSIAYAVANNIQISPEQEYIVAHKDGFRFLMLDGKESLDLGNSGLDYSFILADNEPFVAYTFLHFLALEGLYMKMLNTLKALKVTAISYKSYADEVKTYFAEDFNVLLLNSQPNYQNKDVGGLVQWGDNAPVANTLNIQRQQIRLLNQDIVDILDLQDLFNNQEQDNPTETRVAAANRVAVSQITWEDAQSKVNNFVEKNLKNWVSKQLGVEYSSVDLEINSISILQAEADLAKMEQTVEQIISLIDKASESSPATSKFYYDLIDALLKKASLPEILTTDIKGMIKEQVASKKQQAEEPVQPNLEEEKAMADIEKTKADTQKSLAEADKYKVDSQFKGEEVRIAAEDQAQQTADSNRAILEDKAKGVING